MAWLLFGVGLNLSGVFRVGGGFAGAGSRLAAREGHWGSFFTGALAVLVATPCTAPFMAVAIASGLAAPPPVTVLIFFSMGLGLAVALSGAERDSRVGPDDAAAGPLDGRVAPGAGIPDVRRGGVAALGGQPGGRRLRRPGHRDRLRSAGLCRLEPGHHSGSGRPRTPNWLGRRRLAVALALAAVVLTGTRMILPGTGRGRSAGPETAAAGQRGVHAGATRRVAGRGAAGVRQPDRRLVRHLSGQ